MKITAPKAVRGRIRSFDNEADRLLDLLRGHPTADRLFYGASALGDQSLIWVMLAVLRGLRPGGGDLSACHVSSLNLVGRLFRRDPR